VATQTSDSPELVDRMLICHPISWAVAAAFTQATATSVFIRNLCFYYIVQTLIGLAPFHQFS
jgi:hypothetical protein